MKNITQLITETYGYAGTTGKDMYEYLRDDATLDIIVDEVYNTVYKWDSDKTAYVFECKLRSNEHYLNQPDRWVSKWSGKLIEITDEQYEQILNHQKTIKKILTKT